MRHQTAIRILLVAVVVFSVFAIRSYSKRRVAHRQQVCQKTLQAIEGAKEQFAIEHDGTGPADFSNLIPGYLPSLPVCPAGGTYTLGNMQTGVTCSVKLHVVQWE